MLYAQNLASKWLRYILVNQQNLETLGEFNPEISLFFGESVGGGGGGGGGV